MSGKKYGYKYRYGCDECRWFFDLDFMQSNPYTNHPNYCPKCGISWERTPNQTVGENKSTNNEERKVIDEFLNELIKKWQKLINKSRR